MSRLFLLLLYLILLCTSDTVVVRMTDQKPKWAVQAAKASSKEATPPPSSNQSIDQSTVNENVNPSTSNQNQQSTVDVDSIPKKREPLPFSGPSALVPLQQICGSFNDGHYTYTICPYRWIIQTENQNNGYQGCIGIWGHYSESPDQQHEVRYLFTNGDSCPGDIERQSELIISCDETVTDTLKVDSVTEKEMCHYVIEASSSFICMLKPDDFASIIPEKEVSVTEVVTDGGEMDASTSNSEQQIEMDYDGVTDHMEYDEDGDYPPYDIPPEYDGEYVPADGSSDSIPSENSDEYSPESGNGDSAAGGTIDDVPPSQSSSEDVPSHPASSPPHLPSNPPDHLSMTPHPPSNSRNADLPPRPNHLPRKQEHPQYPHTNHYRVARIKREIVALQNELHELEELIKNYY